MIKRLFLISRPRFWFYLGGTYLLGVIIGAHSVQDIYQPMFFFLLIYFFPFANIYLYGINDVYDQETDKLNEKKESKEVRFDEEKDAGVKNVLLAIFLLSLAIFFMLPNRQAQVFFTLFFFLAHFYSAKPLRFKAKPFLDFSSNSLYIMPGLVGYSLVTQSWPDAKAVIAGALWAMAMHLYSAIPDIKPDKEARVITSAVFLGKQASIWLCIILWSGFSYLTISQEWFGVFGYISLLYPFLGIVTAMQLSAIHKIYWYYPWINTFLGGIAFFFFLIKLL